jgi:hypothetical protein
LQADDRRVGRIQLIDIDLAAKLLVQPIHDGRYRLSGRSVICVKHDQGWPCYLGWRR